jgi:hypothetical protein
MCTIGNRKLFCVPGVNRADLRISIKDYRRNRKLKVLARDGRLASVTRLLPVLGRSLVKTLAAAATGGSE